MAVLRAGIARELPEPSVVIAFVFRHEGSTAGGTIALDLARVRRAGGVYMAENGQCSPAASGLTISLMLAATGAASAVGCPLAQPCHSLKPQQPGIEEAILV